MNFKMTKLRLDKRRQIIFKIVDKKKRKYLAVTVNLEKVKYLAAKLRKEIC